MDKDFHSPNAKTLRIMRGPNARKRKCCAIILNALPQEMRLQLKTSKFTTFSASICVLHNIIMLTL